jgi:hypothetical protein
MTYSVDHHINLPTPIIGIYPSIVYTLFRALTRYINGKFAFLFGILFQNRKNFHYPAPQIFLVELGHLPAKAHITVSIKFGQIPEKLEYTEGGFVKYKGGAGIQEFPEPGPPSARLGGKEAFKDNGFVHAPGYAYQAGKRGGSRYGDNLVACLRGPPYQDCAGVAEAGGSCIAGIGYVFPLIQGGNYFGRGGIFVLGTAGEQGQADFQVAEQFEGPPGIFAGYQGYGSQGLRRPEA